MTRVVIDTNVFVSSFFGGKPKAIIDLWKQGQITICISQAIIEEYIDVLARLGLQDKRQIEALLAIFAKNYHAVYMAQTPALGGIVKSDLDDDKFIECAVALQAEYIITGDKALLEVRKYINIRILSPTDFLQESCLKPWKP